MDLLFGSAQRSRTVRGAKSIPHIPGLYPRDAGRAANS